MYTTFTLQVYSRLYIVEKLRLKKQNNMRAFTAQYCLYDNYYQMYV